MMPSSSTTTAAPHTLKIHCHRCNTHHSNEWQVRERVQADGAPDALLAPYSGGQWRQPSAHLLCESRGAAFDAIPLALRDCGLIGLWVCR